MNETTPNSPYGRKPPSVLDGYAPIPSKQHVRDYARAVNGRGPWYDEVLVEEHTDGTVTLLPSDATPTAWRQIWRKIKQEKEKNHEPL